MLKMAHTLSLLLILNVLTAMMIVTEEVSADENESVADLRVNEVADKGTSDTCDGKDWIELHNAGADTADLSDMVLVDDKGFGDEDQYIFANGSNLSGGEHLVLCKGADFDFGISGDDTVTLFAADGTEVSTSGTMGDLGAPDNTWAYFAEGYAYTEAPTPGAANTADALEHGCTDWPALNYDAEADIDDDSCTYDRPGKDVIFCLADENMACSSESNYLEVTIAPGETFTFLFVVENKGDSVIEYLESAYMFDGEDERQYFGFATMVYGLDEAHDGGDMVGWKDGLGHQYHEEEDSEMCDGCTLQPGESKELFENYITPDSDVAPGTYTFWIDLWRLDRVFDDDGTFSNTWDREYGNATIIIHVEAEESGLPGFGAWAAMIAFIGATGIHSLRSRGRFNRMGPPSD